MNIESVLALAPSFVTHFEFDNHSFGGDRNAVHDPRVVKLDEICRLEGKRILELGPLEGGHTLAMSRLGAREIVAVEGRPENYLKCALIKSLYNLNNANFVFGDLRSMNFEYLGGFDVCVCFGVLYHLPNPFRVLEGISHLSSRVFIWTQYATETYPDGDMQTIELEGFSGDKKRPSTGKWYREVVGKSQAGLQPHSFWLTLDDLLAAVRDAGFQNVDILGRGFVENRMACCLLYATKSSTKGFGKD